MGHMASLNVVSTRDLRIVMPFTKSVTKIE